MKIPFAAAVPKLEELLAVLTMLAMLVVVEVEEVEEVTAEAEVIVGVKVK
eukprot:CAMPEP_0175162454 /NCGR_PEP_ID=MMETSP0087-20121206/25168_1 /TAXON_ID=136419 /ORGANISM="Unknown Unknown, Strain D1" /LENGTH=49 /DNA_ID=CAMNT_0016450979 /DNA_START=121 /DNA_END=270 /DNA_ORIENTATION=-